MTELIVTSDQLHGASKDSLTASDYQAMYQESIADPASFFAKQAESLKWHTPFTSVKNTKFSGDVSIKWFEGGRLNIAENCIDRHLPHRANDTAIIFEGDEPGTGRNITYQELHDEVGRMGNLLKTMRIQKGDRVIIYMPMIPEATYAMLAVARIGAIHSVVFGGFSPEALKGRIDDCKATLIITADEAIRGNKKVPLKANVDKALELASTKIKHVLMITRTGGNVPFDKKRDILYEEVKHTQSVDCPITYVDAEDPLFILYTSGSTGKPKGVLHSTAGYLLYASLTHRYVFDYHQGEVYWCTADVGWITGHSYVVYGPLCNGATTLIFEGVPHYPDFDRFWQIIDTHKVSIFYTAPTAIRALMKEGDAYVKKHDLSSLRVLGTVGEPINPEAWRWYFEVIGHSKCPIVDSWWQTETGGIMITPLPYATTLKAGSATKPFFGIQPVILDEEGQEITGEKEGYLCIKDSWPGQMRTVYGDHDRFIDTYFSRFPGYYMTGDGAKRDKEGDIWIIGRIDDVLNVSGHRIGTAEVESALVLHHDVAEAAVIGVPHAVKGEGIYAFVTVKTGVTPSEDLRQMLINQVRSEIGPFACPETIHFAPGLPKTRSGKIMRRILRKIATNDTENLGDINTLTNPEIIEILLNSESA